MRRAVLQEAIGEPTGGRAYIGADPTLYIGRKGVERGLQLAATSADKRQALPHVKGGIHGHLHPRLVGAALANIHQAGQDQLLRSGPTLYQSARHQQDVQPFLLHTS